MSMSPFCDNLVDLVFASIHLLIQPDLSFYESVSTKCLYFLRWKMYLKILLPNYSLSVNWCLIQKKSGVYCENEKSFPDSFAFESLTGDSYKEFAIMQYIVSVS